MKKIANLLIFSLISILTWAAEHHVPQLTDESYIVVYTCAPGNQLYSQFGHSAIGVIDPKLNINAVFNYGTFSFQTPHFYAKFCAGKLLYRLSAESFARFVAEYEEEGRQVVAQRLNLSLEQRQQLFNNLDENYKPENRYYQYDFFFDNCASRILDMLYNTFDTALTYCNSDSSRQPTLRNCIHPYLQQSLWTKAGIDLALGSITDRCASKREQAFLPDKLCAYIADCKIDTLPLVLDTYEVVKSTIQPASTRWFIAPFTIFLLLFFVILALSIKLPNFNWKIIDCFYFSVLGILGLVVTLLWFATDHGATIWNLNILWASPLYLIYIFVVGKNTKKWYRYLTVILLISNALLLLALYIQNFNICFYPLAAISFLRLFSNLKYLNTESKFGED